MVLWKLLKDIHFTIPEELLVEVDQAAKDRYMSRSEYIRYVLHKEVGGNYPKAVREATKKDSTRFLDLNDS